MNNQEDNLAGTNSKIICIENCSDNKSDDCDGNNQTQKNNEVNERYKQAKAELEQLKKELDEQIEKYMTEKNNIQNLVGNEMFDFSCPDIDDYPDLYLGDSIGKLFQDLAKMRVKKRDIEEMIAQKTYELRRIEGEWAENIQKQIDEFSSQVNVSQNSFFQKITTPITRDLEEMKSKYQRSTGEIEDKTRKLKKLTTEFSSVFRCPKCRSSYTVPATSYTPLSYDCHGVTHTFGSSYETRYYGGQGSDCFDDFTVLYLQNKCQNKSCNHEWRVTEENFI